MKKLKKKLFTIITAIMFMGFVTTAYAQVPQGQQDRERDNTGVQQEQEAFPQNQNQQTLPEDQQEHRRSQEPGVMPQEQSQLGDVDYDEELQESDLPATVTTSLETMYPDHDVEKVLRGSDNSYKVKVKNGDDKKVVFYDESGSFVKEEKAKKDGDKNRK